MSDDHQCSTCRYYVDDIARGYHSAQDWMGWCDVPLPEWVDRAMRKSGLSDGVYDHYGRDCKTWQRR